MLTGLERARTHTAHHVLVHTPVFSLTRPMSCVHALTQTRISPSSTLRLLTWKAAEQKPPPCSRQPPPSQQVPLGKGLEFWREEGRGQRPAKPHWPAIVWRPSGSRTSSRLPVQKDVPGGG